MPRRSSTKPPIGRGTTLNQCQIPMGTAQVDSQVSMNLPVAEDIFLSSTEMQLTESNINFLKAYLQEKFEEKMRYLDAQMEYKMPQLDLEFKRLLLTVPEELLNTPTGLNDEKLRDKLLNILDDNGSSSSVGQTHKTGRTCTTIKRQRSRSARRAEPEYEGKKAKYTSHSRSSSVGALRTPVSKVRLSTLTTSTKYTVSKVKKTENSGISVKRIMKPGEEAISTSGSPLFVHPNIAVAPTVNIPLPGGVVMNIEPKRPGGQITIPELDGKTKEQLRILCQQLNSMFS